MSEGEGDKRVCEEVRYHVTVYVASLAIVATYIKPPHGHATAGLQCNYL